MWGLFAERLSYGYLGELSIKHCLCVASDLNFTTPEKDITGGSKPPFTGGF
jgi:hypothetical protein